MNRLQPRVFAALVFVPLMLLLTACSGSDEGAAPTSTTPDTPAPDIEGTWGLHTPFGVCPNPALAAWLGVSQTDALVVAPPERDSAFDGQVRLVLGDRLAPVDVAFVTPCRANDAVQCATEDGTLRWPRATYVEEKHDRDPINVAVRWRFGDLDRTWTPDGAEFLGTLGPCHEDGRGQHGLDQFGLALNEGVCPTRPLARELGVEHDTPLALVPPRVSLGSSSSVHIRMERFTGSARAVVEGELVTITDVGELRPCDRRVELCTASDSFALGANGLRYEAPYGTRHELLATWRFGWVSVSWVLGEGAGDVPLATSTAHTACS